MKKMMLSALALCAVVFAKAQDSEFKPFKVDVSIGYAIPSGTGAKGGILFVTEPKYAVVDNIAVGLRMEGAVVARVNSTTTSDEVDVKASGSYLATGDYYFTNNYGFRPFAGGGAGLFRLAAATANTNEEASVATGNKFGGMLRAGFEAAHFRLGLEYNLVPSTTLYNESGVATGEKMKNSYIGLKIGVVIGGGPR